MVGVGIRACLVGALVGAALGCGDDGTGGAMEAPSHSLRDSAGIEVVESASPAWSDGEAWTISPTPDLVIGVLEGAGPYQFSELTGATRLSSGAVVAVEGSVREIRVFDANGTHRLSFGGRGEGPGEFDEAPIVSVGAGDTIIALDRRAQRISWFSPDGSLVRDESILERIQAAPGAVAGTRGAWFVSPDGTVLGQVMEGGQPDEPGLGEIRFKPVLFRAGSAPVAEFGEYVRNRVSLIETAPFTFLIVADPVTPTALSVASPGPLPVLISDEQRWELRWHDETGRLAQIARPAIARAPVPDEVITEARARIETLAEAAGRSAAEQLRAFDAIPILDSIPAIGSLHVAPDGTVWAGHRTQDQNAIGRLSVIAADGRYLGDVDLPGEPGALRILGIGADYLLARAVDEFDVQYLHVYGIQKGAG